MSKTGRGEENKSERVGRPEEREEGEEREVNQ